MKIFVLIPFESGHWIGVEGELVCGGAFVLIPFESGHWIGAGNTGYCFVFVSLNPF